MPPLPPLTDSYGHRLMRAYSAALGYATGHCYVTATGDWYSRQIAGWTGVATGALVLMLLIVLHAQAQQDRAESRVWHEAAQFIRDLRARSDTQSQPVAPHE